MYGLFGLIFRLRVHLICWSVYIGYEVLTTGMIRGYYSHFFFYVVFYPLNILLFYIHGKWVMNRAFSTGVSWIWKLPLLVILEFAAYAAISVMLNLWLYQLGATLSEPQFDLRFFISVLWRAALFVMFATGYYFLISDLNKKVLAMERALEIERLGANLVRAEMDVLRSQINPHLLFNTLNFVKYAAKRDPELADEAIQRLSELMRFALEERNGGLVELSAELAQVENMIRLNQLRFADRIFLKYVKNVEERRIGILPVLLLTLLENVFKHGELRDPGFAAEIRVCCSDARLEFSSVNLMRATGFRNSEQRQGAGLKNIRSRLEMAYPGRFRFEYGLEDKIFSTYLSLDIGNDGFNDLEDRVG